MQLDQMWINPQIQDKYAQTIAIEDILEEYYPDNQSNNNPQPKQGETNNAI